MSDLMGKSESKGVAFNDAEWDSYSVFGES